MLALAFLDRSARVARSIDTLGVGIALSAGIGGATSGDTITVKTIFALALIALRVEGAVWNTFGENVAVVVVAWA